VPLVFGKRRPQREIVAHTIFLREKMWVISAAGVSEARRRGDVSAWPGSLIFPGHCPSSLLVHVSLQARFRSPQRDVR
jgi:hypothetical protein